MFFKFMGFGSIISGKSGYLSSAGVVFLQRQPLSQDPVPGTNVGNAALDAPDMFV